MNRVARYIFNGLATLSLLLCLATVVLWVRSYWIGDVMRWVEPATSGSLSASRGELGVLWLGIDRGANMNFRDGTPTALSYARLPPHDLGLKLALMKGRTVDRQFAGARYVAGKNFSLAYRQVIVPMWIVTMTSAVPGVWMLVSLRKRGVRRRWARCGLCRSCGYDLRATPDRCPECGTGAKT